MAVIHNFVLVISMLGLAACGGGDPSSNGSNQPPLVIAKQSTVDNAQENSTVTLTFASTGSIGALRVTDESAPSANTPVSGSVQVSGNVITYTATVGDSKVSNGIYTVALTVTDDSRSIKVSHSFSVDNPTGRVILDRLKSTQSAVSSFAELTEEKRLADKAEQIASLVSTQYLSKEAEFKAKLTAAISEVKAQTTLKNWQDKASSIITSYGAGTVNEDALNALLSDLNAPLSNYANKYNAALTELLAQAAGVIPEIVLGKVSVSSDGRFVSQFIGNPAFGTYVDGKWVYSKSYQFLTAVTAPETIPCSVQ